MAARKFGYLAIVLLMSAMGVPAMAQGKGDGFVVGGKDGGGKASPPDRAQMQQRQLQMIQQVLGSTDEEFAVLSPKINRVLTLRGDANLPGSGGGRIVGGSGLMPIRNPDGSPLPPARAARAELQNIVQDPSAGSDSINTKLEAYLSALAKTREELAGAQKDVVALLTRRQQAQLVLLNILD